MTTTHQPVAIFWDFENCSLALGRTGFTVARNIESIAQKYGSLKLFKAYLDAQKQPLGSDVFRAELQSSGVSVTDCPHIGRKEVADRMLQGDLMSFALDYPAPATVIIISADRDFAYAASVLRQRRYNVVMISHSNPRPNLWLISQAVDCYDWKKDVLHVEEPTLLAHTTLSPGKTVPSHADLLAQCLASIPPPASEAVHAVTATTTQSISLTVTDAAASRVDRKTAAVSSTAGPVNDSPSLSHIPPKLRCLVQALHTLAPTFAPVPKTRLLGKVKALNPQCSRDEFKQLLRAGRANHLIKTGSKPQKWVCLRPDCLGQENAVVQVVEELVDSGHESSSSDEEDAVCETPIPPGFDVVVHALRDVGSAGDYRMKLGDVAVLVAKHNRRPYLLAGVGKLKGYLEAGERHGVIRRVGPKTTYLMNYVALTEKYRPGYATPPSFIKTHSRRSSDTTVVSDSVEELNVLVDKPPRYVDSDSGFEEEEVVDVLPQVSPPVLVEKTARLAAEPCVVAPALSNIDNVELKSPTGTPIAIDAALEPADVSPVAMPPPQIPSGFDVLVRALQDIGPGGEYRMKRFDLAELISVKHGRAPYAQAGVGKFNRYLEVAVSKGIVEISGKKGKTMVILTDTYRSSPVVPPSASLASIFISEQPAEPAEEPSSPGIPQPDVDATNCAVTVADPPTVEDHATESIAVALEKETVDNQAVSRAMEELPREVKTTPFSEQSSWAFELISPNPPEIELDFSCTESLEALVANSNTFLTYDTLPAASAEEDDASAVAAPNAIADTYEEYQDGNHAIRGAMAANTIGLYDEPSCASASSAGPADFDILLDVLHTHAAKGFSEPLRSIVDFDLHYRLGWEGDLDGLFDQAESAGVIRTGMHRYSGLAWVALTGY